MSRLVIVGFTMQLIDRLCESAGFVARDDVLIVLNQCTQELVAQVERAGLKRVALADFAPRVDDRLLLGVLRPATKRKVIGDYCRLHPGADGDFRPAIHRFTSISPTSIVGDGCFIEPGVVIAPRATLSRFVSVNRNASIGHHTSVGAWCMINPGTNVASNCEIGEAVTIGMGSNVFEGVRIGAETVIGGGSVVTKDVPAGVLAYGSPCKVIRQL